MPLSMSPTAPETGLRPGPMIWSGTGQGRLVKGTFRFPEAKGNRVEVTPTEITAVLERIELRYARRLARFARSEPQSARLGHDCHIIN